MEAKNLPPGRTLTMKGHSVTQKFWGFGLGVPLTFGVFYAFLGFYNRNGFISGFEPGRPPKYAHVAGERGRCPETRNHMLNHCYCCLKVSIERYCFVYIHKYL